MTTRSCAAACGPCSNRSLSGKWQAKRRQGERRSISRSGDAPRAPITQREREIIQLLAEGRSNKECASALGVSVKTVEAHRANIMRKLHLRSASDLVRYAVRNNIVQA